MFTRCASQQHHFLGKGLPDAAGMCHLQAAGLGHRQPLQRAASAALHASAHKRLGGGQQRASHVQGMRQADDALGMLGHGVQVGDGGVLAVVEHAEQEDHGLQAVPAERRLQLRQAGCTGSSTGSGVGQAGQCRRQDRHAVARSAWLWQDRHGRGKVSLALLLTSMAALLVAAEPASSRSERNSERSTADWVASTWLCTGSSRPLCLMRTSVVGQTKRSGAGARQWLARVPFRLQTLRQPTCQLRKLITAGVKCGWMVPVHRRGRERHVVYLKTVGFVMAAPAPAASGAAAVGGGGGWPAAFADAAASACLSASLQRVLGGFERAT